MQIIGVPYRHYQLGCPHCSRDVCHGLCEDPVFLRADEVSPADAAGALYRAEAKATRRMTRGWYYVLALFEGPETVLCVVSEKDGYATILDSRGELEVIEPGTLSFTLVQ